MPAVLVLFSIVVFGLLFGVLGGVLAVPLAVALAVLIKKLWMREVLGDAPWSRRKGRRVALGTAEFRHVVIDVCLARHRRGLNFFLFSFFYFS